MDLLLLVVRTAPFRMVLFLILILLGLSLADNKKRAMMMWDILDDTDDYYTTNNNIPSFCASNKMDMTMYMDGLHWSLLFFKNPQQHGCLNYFVQTWKLQNAAAFRGACLFSFLLAVLVEGLSAFRLKVIQSTRRSHVVLTAIYGMQALLGYSIMIIVMSFSVELILSVCAGLVMGHWLLVMRVPDARPSHALPSPETTRPLLNAQQLRRRNQ